MAESWYPLLPKTGWVLPPCREPPCGALGVRAGARASSSGWTGEADKGPVGERHSQPRGLGTRAALWDRGQWVAAGVRSQGWGWGGRARAGSHEGVRASSTPARPWLPSAEGHSALGVGGDWRPYSIPTMELCLLATEVGGGPASGPSAHIPLLPSQLSRHLGPQGKGEGWELQAPGPPGGGGSMEPPGGGAEDGWSLKGQVLRTLDVWGKE